MNPLLFRKQSTLRTLRLSSATVADFRSGLASNRVLNTASNPARKPTHFLAGAYSRRPWLVDRCGPEILAQEFQPVASISRAGILARIDPARGVYILLAQNREEGRDAGHPQEFELEAYRRFPIFNNRNRFEISNFGHCDL